MNLKKLRTFDLLGSPNIWGVRSIDRAINQLENYPESARCFQELYDCANDFAESYGLKSGICSKRLLYRGYSDELKFDLLIVNKRCGSREKLYLKITEEDKSTSVFLRRRIRKLQGKQLENEIREEMILNRKSMSETFAHLNRFHPRSVSIVKKNGDERARTSYSFS
jgi:hypothetical protein